MGIFSFLSMRTAQLIPEVSCACGARCRSGVAMDAPARFLRLGAATREGLPRKRRFDARVMQLIAE
jgi:hypothetical protein